MKKFRIKKTFEWVTEYCRDNTSDESTYYVKKSYLPIYKVQMRFMYIFWITINTYKNIYNPKFAKTSATCLFNDLAKYGNTI